MDETTRRKHEAMNTFARYITEQRLYGVVSKVGFVEESKKGTLIAAFVDDAWDDFKKDHEALCAKLNEGEQRAVKKGPTQTAFKLVQTYLSERDSPNAAPAAASTSSSGSAAAAAAAATEVPTSDSTGK